jgi:nitrous oxidase accessory protein
VSLFNDLVVRNPSLRLFTLSPAQAALDLAARAFPVFRPAPVLTDTAPRTAPAAAAVRAPARAAWPLALAAGALVAVALLVGLWGAGLDRAPWQRSAPAAGLEVTA